MIESRLYAWLAYLGIAPFLVAAIMIALGQLQLILVGDLTYFVNSYGLVIVAFMSGIHWGQYISVENSRMLNLLLSSIFIALIAWSTFLLATIKFTLAVYVILFTILLAIDAKLYSVRVISKQYFVTRCIVTFMVILSLVITMYGLTKHE